MNCGENCSNNICIAVIISVVVGAIVGVLFAFGLIPAITTAIWISFGLAVLNLIFLVAGLFTAALFKRTLLARCLRCNGAVLLAGIIGTIVLSIALLSIVLVVTSIGIAALVAIGAFFTALMLVSLIYLLTCILDSLR